MWDRDFDKNNPSGLISKKGISGFREVPSCILACYFGEFSRLIKQRSGETDVRERTILYAGWDCDKIIHGDVWKITMELYQQAGISDFRGSVKPNRILSV